MLKVIVEPVTQTVLLEPDGHLSKQDFEALAQQVDPLINQFGNLNGLLVHARQFPGWDSFAAFIAHIQFVNGHHNHVKKIALCTDSAFGSLAEKLAAHFITADIKVFPYDQFHDAKQWIGTSSTLT